MSSPSVLVTGGAGFIGSHVAQRFQREGFAVRVLDDLSSGLRENLSPAWDLRLASVTDADATASAVEGCQIVVHLAAFTSVADSFARHDECYRSNVHGTFNVLEACSQRGVERLVFASSSAVYAELPDAPKCETETAEPISPYAVSKLEGEHLLDIFRARHELSSAAMRFFNVFGPRQAADSDYAAAVPIFFERCLRGEPLTIYGDGQQTRDFVFVSDVADAIFCASQSQATGAFNVGTGSATGILELAETIQKLSDTNSSLDFAPRRAGDLLSSTAEVSRTRRELGWQAQVSLAEGLSETLRWQRESNVSAEG